LLFEYAPGRFGSHDLLRAYAAELTQSQDSAEERRAATGRMLDHYLHTAASAALLLHPTRRPVTLISAGPGAKPEYIADVAQALAWFQAERRVLIAAATRAGEEGFDVHAWQIPWAMSRFLDTRGRWHEWTITEQIALAAAQRLGDRAAQAGALQRCGYANARLGNYDDAYRMLGEALSIHTEHNDKAGQAYVHNALAITLNFQGHYEDALGHAEQALDKYTVIGDQSGRALALNSCGWFHTILGDQPRAISYATQALDLFRKLGNQEGVASALDSLGYAEQQGGRFSTATRYFREAADLYREIGSRWGLAEALNHLGDAEHADGHRAEARTAWEEAYLILDDLGHPDAPPIKGKLRELDADATR
jgi:tetratricopeptide (TPR) repeat protein